MVVLDLQENKIMNIKIKYNGDYPNLCSGELIVYIDDKEWVFPNYCLSSGGSVSFDEEWNECVCSGDWYVEEWPEEFPEDMKSYVLTEINEQIEHGCCGGCI